MDPKAVEHVKEILHDKNRIWGHIMNQGALATGLDVEQLAALVAGLLTVYLTFGDHARIVANFILMALPLFIYIFAPQEKPKDELMMVYGGCFIVSTILDPAFQSAIPAYYVIKIIAHLLLFLHPFCVAEKILPLWEQVNGREEKKEGWNNEHKLFSKEELIQLFSRKDKSPPPEKPEGERPSKKSKTSKDDVENPKESKLQSSETKNNKSEKDRNGKKDRTLIQSLAKPDEKPSKKEKAACDLDKTADLKRASEPKSSKEVNEKEKSAALDKPVGDKPSEKEKKRELDKSTESKVPQASEMKSNKELNGKEKNPAQVKPSGDKPSKNENAPTDQNDVDKTTDSKGPQVVETKNNEELNGKDKNSPPGSKEDEKASKKSKESTGSGKTSDSKDPLGTETKDDIARSPPDHYRTAVSPSVSHQISDKPGVKDFRPVKGQNEMEDTPESFRLDQDSAEGCYEPNSPLDGRGVGAYDIEWEPRDRIIFNAPFDHAHLTYHMLMKNVSRFPVAFAIKSNAIPRVTASPATGILKPDQSIYVSVTVQKMDVFDEDVVAKDRIAFEYVRVPAETPKFEFSLLQMSKIKLRKNIHIKYNP